jgi:hypothetical protein
MKAASASAPSSAALGRARASCTLALRYLSHTYGTVATKCKGLAGQFFRMLSFSSYLVYLTVCIRLDVH